MSASAEPGSSSDGPDPVEAQLERVRLLLDLQRWADAAASASLLLGTQPDLAPAWLHLADAELGRDDAWEALTALRRGLALDPEQLWGHQLAALVLLELGRAPEALTAARTALRLDSEDPTTFVVLARVHVALSEPAAAWSAAQRALALDPHRPDGHDALGRAADALKRPKVAEKAYLRSLELDPTNAGALNNLGAHQINRGRIGPAARSLAAALANDPRLGVARENIDALGASWTRQVYFASLAALVAVVAGLGIEALLGPGAPAVRRTVAVAAFVGLAGWVTWAWVDLPVPVRRVLRRRLLGRELRLALLSIVTVLGTAAMLATVSAAAANLGPIIRILGMVTFVLGCVMTARRAARSDLVMLTEAQRAVARHPGDADALATVGLAALRLRRHAVGDEANRQALELDPGHVRALLNTAARHLGRWRLRAGAASLAPVLALAPRSPRVRQSMDAYVVAALLLLYGVLLLGDLALLAGLVRELDPAAEGSPSLRAAIGAGTLLVLVGVAAHVVRAAPRALRRPLLGRALHRPVLALPVLAVVTMLATVVVIAWGDIADPRPGVAVQSVLMPLTATLALGGRKRVRRMAGRAREVEPHP